MNRYLLLFLLTVLTLTVMSQTNAITETGDKVILYDDGTWEYIEEMAEAEEAIPVNPNSFTKSEDADFLLKSKNMNVGFWINTDKWSFEKAAESSDSEYEVDFKNGDLYATIITEGIQIPLIELRSIALENARSVASDAKIAKNEFRNVNGMEVMFMKINGTIRGINFSYVGYYYSDESGTVQFITMTSSNLMEKYESECEELLNGLVQVKKQ